MQSGVTATRSVERALTLLAHIAESNEGIPLAAAARDTNLSASTALRLIRTLQRWEFVRRDADGTFHGGPRLLATAAKALSSQSVYQLAVPHLTEMCRDSGESCYLAVVGPAGQALYVRQEQSPRSIRHVSWVGRTVPLSGTAIGGALTGSPSEGPVALRSTLEPDVTAVAAPVCWGEDVVAAISVVGPSYRIDDATLVRFGELVAAHARELSVSLGRPEAGR